MDYMFIIRGGNMKDKIEEIGKNALQELDNCSNLKSLEDLRVKYLGKKVSLQHF